MEENKEMNLDEGLAKLEEIISSMEDPQISLEQSFALYKEGVENLKACTEMVDNIEKELIVLEEERGV